MRYSTDLYEFIAAMSQTEKAYFSKFGLKYDKEDSSLKDLYKAINDELAKGKDIDDALEPGIQRKLARKIPKRHFPKLKRRLFDALLSATYEHNKPHSEEEYYWHARRRSDTLFSKGMNEAAWQELEKPLAEAMTKERFEIAMLLQRKQNLIAVHQQDRERLQTGLAKQKQLSQRYLELNELQCLYDQLYHIHRMKGQDKEGKLLGSVEELSLHPALSERFSPSSITSAIRLQSIHQVRAFILNDAFGSLSATASMADLYVQHPEVLSCRPETLMGIISNLLTDSLQLGIFHYYEKYMPVLRQQNYPSKQLQHYQQYQLLKIQINHAYISNQFDRFAQLEEEFLAWRSRPESSMNMDGNAILTQLMVIGFFTSGQHGKCIQWCHDFFGLCRKQTIREDHLVECELIQLAIHTEARAEDLVESLLRSIRHRLGKAGRLSSLAHIQLAFTKRYIRNPHHKSEVQSLIQKALDELEGMHYPASNYVVFDFPLWLKAIRSGSSYTELVKAQNRALMEATLSERLEIN